MSPDRVRWSDVLSINHFLRILGESLEHHGLSWYLVAPVGLHQEVQSDLVEAREEVESEPGTLSGTSWPGVTWCTPGSDREDLESVGLEKMVGGGWEDPHRNLQCWEVSQCPGPPSGR